MLSLYFFFTKGNTSVYPAISVTKSTRKARNITSINVSAAPLPAGNWFNLLTISLTSASERLSILAFAWYG
jgi:hypothetical protein